MMRVLSIILFIGLFTACQNEMANQSADQNKKTPAPTPVAYYEALPVADQNWIMGQCDYIDYLYYELPMSMSFHDKASITSAVAHISPQAAPKKIPCKSIGRIAYQQDGEIMLEAEMHFANNCGYLVFLKNNKPVYGNAMTTDAINFYKGVFERAKVVPK